MSRPALAIEKRDQVTLAVERHEGNSLWLVIIADPLLASRRLARFLDEDAAMAWTTAHAYSQTAAREAGRLGF